MVMQIKLIVPYWLDFNVCANRLNCMLKICCVEAISKVPTLKQLKKNEESLKKMKNKTEIII